MAKWLKNKMTSPVQLTPQQRQELIRQISNNLNDEELVLLNKALQRPLIKSMAIRELKKIL